MRLIMSSFIFRKIYFEVDLFFLIGLRNRVESLIYFQFNINQYFHSIYVQTFFIYLLTCGQFDEQTELSYREAKLLKSFKC